MPTKVLFLATYFPRPANLRMGTWSLAHAVALKNQNIDVHVLSLTPWFPRTLGAFTTAVRQYSHCPPKAVIDNMHIDYPRWLCYPIKQCQRIMQMAPELCLRIGWLSARQQIAQTVRRFSPHLVLANHSLVNGYVALAIKSKLGIPYITVDHEVGDFIACKSNRRSKNLLEKIHNEASARITVSNSMKSIAEEILPNQSYRTIYNGANFDECNPKQLERHSHNGGCRVFCCGNLYGRKDIPLLLQAFSRLYPEFPNSTLRIAGDGPERKSIENLIQSLPCKDRVELLGSISHTAVQAEMAAADIFALVGWAEPFGVVFLEAMAQGCPIVVSEDAGVSEILTNGQTALFTKPRDLESVVMALRNLFSNPNLRKSIATKGRNLYSTSCTWNHRASEYSKLFSEVLG